MEQRSPEWFAARLGKVTASRIGDVMAKLKSGGDAAGRKNYRAQLVVERLTGLPVECFVNGAMSWGTDHEPDARASYEFITGNTVEEIGFVDHPTIPKSGASPDGLIGEDGLIEIKCPNTATHIDYLLKGKAPAGYLKQMNWQMECTGRKWCDFVSYDPRMPIDLQLFIVRVERDEELTTDIVAAVDSLLVEVEQVINDLAKRQGLQPAAINQ
jgi:putative phage-type endonuclease